MSAPPRLFASLSAMQVAAREALDDKAWAYLDTGAGSESTLADNRAAFDRWRLLPQPLSGITEVGTRTTFLGRELSSPILTGPVGTYTAFHEEGDIAVARAAQRFGTGSLVPVLSSFTLEETAAQAPGAAQIFQALASGPEESCVELGRRAAAAGYSALCLTVDAYPRGIRDRVADAGFDLPASTFAANYATDAETEMELHIELGRHAWSWQTARRVIEAVPLPVMIKGVLTPAAAEAALDAGAAGIMVSNVGGRQLDGAPSSLQQLPSIVDAVGGAMPIAFDSGVRRGSDVFKALALGADVVSLGRTVAMALAAGGEDGVLAALELVNEELVTTMALCGIAHVEDITPDVLQPVACPCRLGRGAAR